MESVDNNPVRAGAQLFSDGGQFLHAAKGSNPRCRFQTTWKMALAIQTLMHSFCAGPVALYAAGHLEDFVRTMVLADLDNDHKDLLLEVLDSVIEEATTPTAAFYPCDPKVRVPVEMRQAVPVDFEVLETRTIWSFLHTDADLSEKFEQGWTAAQNGVELPDDADVDAAHLAATNIDAPLIKRRRVIIASLRRYFQRLDEEAERVRLGPST
jgi:hypothetical protein